MKNRRENGIALITALLVLLLISSIMVGLAWMVMTDQKLGGNNADRDTAFYGAESGLESLTAALNNQFDLNYNLSAADINKLMTTPPVDVPNIQFLTPTGGNGYDISFTPDPANGGNPLAANHTILSGTYAGLVGLLTPYTLSVTARTAEGSEVRLQRVVQTAAIPVFQFGIFSDTDVDFFAGPDFNFGGRVHTNGNLWLAEGGTLKLSDKVTAVGQIIRTNLENGHPTSSGYTGTVDITTNPGSNSYAPMGPNDGSTAGGSTSQVGAISASLNPAFPAPIFAGNVQNKVAPLNLGIATPSLGGQPIDLLRLPVPGEDVTNPAKLAERYYAQASVRILLSDYGPKGGCSDSDLTNLPDASPNAANDPVDLATLAFNGKNAGPAWYGANFPLPLSAAQNALKYTANELPTGANPPKNFSDGYWIKNGKPIITGCIKIDYQNKAGTGFVDITQQVLAQGLSGRNIYPDWPAQNPKNPPSVAGPLRPFLPTAGQERASGPTANAGVATVGCTDPSGTAIIRLARVRDNPAGAPTGGCGGSTWAGSDYWPNVLYDTREAISRDNSLPAIGQLSPGGQLPLSGAMSYVELDVANLAAYLNANSGTINNVTGYTIYFSDRRGDRTDPNPPNSVGGGVPNMKTGGYGYDDFANPGDIANGCPNGILDAGEGVEDDFTMGVDLNPNFKDYGGGKNLPATVGGQVPTTSPYNEFWYVNGSDPSLANVLTGVAPATVESSTFAALTPLPVFASNPKCPGNTTVWPGSTAVDARDLRENPPVFFRRALKIVKGSNINIGVCDAVNCGLTIVSENPVYLQGDYNNSDLSAGFTGNHVATAVIADAVTLLSDKWNDVNSFAFPYDLGNRTGVSTTYRLAVVGGKGIPFVSPGGANGQDYGTDGGMHNFLRYLENWGGQTLSYRGSIVSFFYNHQAVGPFKCCNTVYSPPTRGYNFDTEFLTPSLLPPKTPMLRAINTIGFSQVIVPTAQ